MTTGDQTGLPVRHDRPGIQSEISIIPSWAYIVAAIVFVTIPVCFYLALVGPHRVPASELPFPVLISFIPATLLGFLALMIGYVNQDSGRRGMNRTLWTLIVIFVPNAIGFIIYFLLRSPLRVACPKCSAVVDSKVNFCPNCRYSFHPACPQCKNAVNPGDTFCHTCGTPLKN
jgi:RNA polymerase subunit RPABC4/transcription elongation factor Spt4